MIKLEEPIDEWMSIQHGCGKKGERNYYVIDGLVNVRTGEFIEVDDVDNWNEFIRDYYRRLK